VQFPDQPFVRPAVLAYSRIVEAVRLYFLAKKNDCPCSIVISGGDAPRTGVTEAEDYRAEMLRLGVEDSDIVPEGRSLNTFQKEVLQLCSHAVIGWLDAPLASSVCGLIKWRQFEPEVIRIRLSNCTVFRRGTSTVRFWLPKRWA